MGDIVEVKVLFFAKAREIAGLNETKLKISKVISYSELLKDICLKYNLGILKDNLILAVNEVYCDTENQLTFKEFDEIAVIPPLSGG